MLTNEIELLAVLKNNGFPVAAKNLLRLMCLDFAAKADGQNDFAVKLEYLNAVVVPEWYGRSTRALPTWVEQKLAWREQEIDWNTWLEFFPGSSVEFLVDREGGEAGELSRERLVKLSNSNFLEKRAGLFYSPNGFGERPLPSMRRRRAIANVVKLNAVFVDLDGASTPEAKENLKKVILEMVIPPSFVVETRNGFHVIWRLNDLGCTENVKRWQSTQKGLIAYYGGDKACKDVSRLLRMPSSWHCKEVFRGGEPYWVHLMLYYPERVYDLEIFERFKLKEDRVFELGNFVPSGEVLPPTLSGLSTGERHAALVSEVARVYARLGSDKTKATEARAVVREWYRGACLPLKANWEREIDSYCDWVEQKQFGVVG